MKETLHVKNFGPIADVYIEIKDINIFIGTTSSGKSTIAKLIAIFKSGQLLGVKDLLGEFNVAYESHIYIFNRACSNFNMEYEINEETLIRYEFGELFYEIRFGAIESNFDSLEGKGLLNPIYIPAERAFFPTFSRSIFNFLSYDIALPKWLVDFGANFEKSRLELNSFHIDFLKARYVFSQGNDYVELDNGAIIKLSQASSGMQSTIPMVLVLEHFTNPHEGKDDMFVIEEPELNLYPSAQKDLMEFIIRSVKKSQDKLVITTHSPYLLTTLDNHIQAGNIAFSNPALSASVADIIPEDLWVDFEKVSCYFFNNGTVKSTLDDEAKSIGPSNIDDVSDELSETFEKLLALKYMDK